MKSVILSYLHTDPEGHVPEPPCSRDISESQTQMATESAVKMPRHHYGTRSKARQQQGSSACTTDVNPSETRGNEQQEVIATTTQLECPKPLVIPQAPWPYPPSYYCVPFGPNVQLSVRDQAAIQFLEKFQLKESKKEREEDSELNLGSTGVIKDSVHPRKREREASQVTNTRKEANRKYVFGGNDLLLSTLEP